MIFFFRQIVNIVMFMITKTYSLAINFFDSKVILREK